MIKLHRVLAIVAGFMPLKWLAMVRGDRGNTVMYVATLRLAQVETHMLMLRTSQHAHGFNVRRSPCRDQAVQGVDDVFGLGR